MENKKNTKKFICKTCCEETTKLGHLCDPKTTTKNAKLYVCQDCGLITTEAYLLCKPKILKTK